MFKKTLLLALALTACLTTIAWADGRIWGYITYKNCSPDARDIVCIRPVSGGGCIWTGFVQIQYGPRYNTLPSTIPPGSYYIYVIPHQGSDCIGCVPLQGFVHGTDNQQCDIESCGPDVPNPRSEPGP